MQTNLTLKHLGYSLTALAAGLLLIAMTTAGFLIMGLALVGLLGSIGVLLLGRWVEAAKVRWDKPEAVDREWRSVAALKSAQSDRHAHERTVARWLTVAELLPFALVSLLYVAALPLVASLIGIWTALFVLPLLRQMWFRAGAYRAGIRTAREVEPDDSVVISRSEAPALFEAIDELAASLPVAAPGEVRLSAAPTAHVYERTEGRGRAPVRVLVLGVPLIRVFSVAQLRSVVAHELAHLANDDVAVARRAYQARRRWDCIHEEFEKRGLRSWLFRASMMAVLDRLEPLLFASAREAELRADAVSARALGGRAAADALLHVSVMTIDRDAALHGFMAQHAALAVKPPQGFVQHMTEAAARRFEPMRLRAKLMSSLCDVTSNDDVHPAVGDRIERVGAPVELSSPDMQARIDQLVDSFVADAQANPALALLPGGGEQIIERVDAAWQRAANRNWEQLRFLWRDRMARVEQQERDAERGIRTPWLAYERARIAHLTHGDDVALPLLTEAISLGPDEPAINFALGSALYARGDTRCSYYLTQALRLDPSSTQSVLPMLAAMSYLAGDPVAGDQHRASIRDRRRLERQARDERREAVESHHFAAIKLDATRERQLVELLWSLEPVVSANLACAVVQVLPAEPCHAIALSFGERTSGLDMQRCAESVLNFMSNTSRGVEVSVVYYGVRPETDGVKRIADSLVFTRLAATDYHRLAA